LLNLFSSHSLIKPFGTLTTTAFLSLESMAVFLNQVVKLALVKESRYGDTVLSFFRKKEDVPESDLSR